jgi:hypothetical protein
MSMRILQITREYLCDSNATCPTLHRQRFESYPPKMVVEKKNDKNTKTSLKLGDRQSIKLVHAKRCHSKSNPQNLN